MSTFLFIATRRRTTADMKLAFGSRCFFKEANESVIGKIVLDGTKDWTAFYMSVHADASSLLGLTGRIKRGKFIRTQSRDDRALLWSGCAALFKDERESSVRLFAHLLHGYWNLESAPVLGKKTLYLDGVDVGETALDLDVLYTIKAGSEPGASTRS